MTEDKEQMIKQAFDKAFNKNFGEDKEIIIDGVDVAGCKDYREVEYKEMPICMNYYNHLPKPPKGTEWQYCAGNKDCYYKQLKRLEQENKELKKQIESDKGLITVGGKQQYEYLQRIDELEQENKELKEKIIELSEEKGHLIVENNTLKESNQSLSMLGTDLASANETVRKEFFRADKNKDMWREKAEEYRSALEEIREYCNSEHGSVYVIIDKINEVLND